MRLSTTCFMLFFGALSFVFSGCSKPKQAMTPATPTAPATPDPGYVVAMANGTPLTWEETDRRAMGFLKDDVDTNHLIIPTNRMEEAKEYFRKRAINAFVFKTIMLDEAIRQDIRLTDADRQEGLKILATTLKTRNWTTNDFFQKGPMSEPIMRREFDDGLIIDKLLKIKIRSTIRIETAEIEQAGRMIVATNELKRAKLEAVRKQLLEGANFEDVARTVSECPSAAKGGDLGEIPRGKMDKAFEEAAFSQKVGEIGPVVETRFGYHIIKVTSHTPAQAATATTPAIPETVRVSHILIQRVPINQKRITESLMRTKYAAGVQKYFTDLKAHAKIECFLYKDMTF